MVSWDVAVMAMIAVSTTGFLLADGEKRRVRWIQAMRRCLLRMNGIIRYEQPGLGSLLRSVDIRQTQQEKELTRLLHACADRLESGADTQLSVIFASESARFSSYGVLCREDRAAFEAVVGGLGRSGLVEQIRLIDEADERLRSREETLAGECARRIQMIRTLSLSGGAAVFLILI